MAVRLPARQVNGELMHLEVTAEMTGKELKQQIKEGQLWDEVTHQTTVVEIVVGDRLLDNDEVVDAGQVADAVVTVVFKPNIARCSKKGEFASFGSDLDLDHPFVVEIPDHETQIGEHAFVDCNMLTKVVIPNSVTHIGGNAFDACSRLADLTIPNSVTHIGDKAFRSCRSLAI
ncbi:Putative surface protein bspA-like (TvBspA-like-625) [Durusdinium trenchii]|uniref:Surface protein bspA-like (TvBspA-like-625) n=1 Tax=Durusdinium trenchii TaxID=1381693 RepID=A0ABP0J7W5_9DINO